MAKPTNESQVKRELRTPKYRSRVETDEKKESKIRGMEVTEVFVDEEINLNEELALCDHGYLAGCPFCRRKIGN
ncbi:MAG: hypothetical protein GOVbin1096_131 [Prokaryotic dsDNA virus sp.]|jgi:hypothetical protein|nr:MAG: hypothetical protein GOVbin1096_131 [Prokaryotic dsDNA virus sp.]|tara:strand:- start:34077 stop:34298 length:222 start_codon:yes stop_codon:yes gene_type:complete